jgi:DNA-binding transcriptional MerR regulator
MTQTTNFSVGEAAERTGFSIDTLRYYERLGLLVSVSRDVGGRRRYTPDDLEWLGLLSCLRGTGMPIREMQEFAAMVRAGDADLSECQRLLEDHRARVVENIAELTRRLERIDGKIAYYRDRQRG